MHASIVLVTASLHCSKAAASAPRCHRSQPSASAAGADGASAAQQHPSPGERLRVPRSRRRAHREGADARSVAQVGTAAVDGVRRPQQHVPRLAQVLRRWVRRAVVRDEGRQGGRHRALLVGPEALRVVPEEPVPVRTIIAGALGRMQPRPPALMARLTRRDASAASSTARPRRARPARGRWWLRASGHRPSRAGGHAPAWPGA